MSALDFGKGKCLIGQHGKQTVGVLRGRKLHKCRGQLHHEMCPIRAIGRVPALHFLHNAPRFGFNQPSTQGGGMFLEVARCQFIPFFLPVKGIVARPGRWVLLQSVQTSLKKYRDFR